MAKKATLDTLAAQMTEGFARLTTTVDTHGNEIHDLTESVGFIVKHMATKEDLAELCNEMATKEQLSGLQMQVNSIERQLRETNTEVRLGDLEEKVFGKVRR